jgi:hypothetical protein
LITTALIKMKVKIFQFLLFLFLLDHVSPFVLEEENSTKDQSPPGEAIQNPFNENILWEYFIQFCKKPDERSYDLFESCAQIMYAQNPVGCLEFLEQCPDNYPLIILFWRSITPIDHKGLSPVVIFRFSPGESEYKILLNQRLIYSFLLHSIRLEIESIFLNLHQFDKEKFENSFKVIPLLIKFARNIVAKAECIELNYDLIETFKGKILTWKFILKNLSIGFNHQTINYISLFTLFGDIRSVIKKDPAINLSSTNLSCCCSLLILYLHYIEKTESIGILESQNFFKIPTIYLIIFLNNLLSGLEDNVLDMLLSFLKDLFIKDSSGMLTMIASYVRDSQKYTLKKINKLPGMPKGIKNFRQLKGYLEQDSLKKDPEWSSWTSWNVKGFAELEFYILREVACKKLEGHWDNSSELSQIMTEFS